MNQTLWIRLDQVARSLFPFALTLLLVIASMVPSRVPGLSPITPALGMIAVFYWVLYRPDLMPAWAVSSIGLLQDLLSGGPLGINVLVLLVLYATVAAQRRFLGPASFPLVWAVFLVVSAGAFLVSWVFACMISGTLIDPVPSVFQYLTTAAAYPCCAWVFARAQRTQLR